jgi:phospholipase D1/2
MMNAIKEAEHYIYIENQFFITSSADEKESFNNGDQEIRNKIGRALVEKVIQAYK